MKKLPFRQIHLDFHTSPYIENIGEDFSSDEFVKTLKDNHINSINLFTKCHHGMFYYPTKIGTVHPHLKFDLFGEQVKACKEAGIRAVAYTCVAWNEDWCDRHPEWQVLDFDGVLGHKNPFDIGYHQWRSLCENNADYVELLKAEFKEIYDLYKPDGYWIDIVIGKDCICPHCTADMKSLGLDPKCYEDVQYFNTLSETKFCKIFYEFLKDIDPKLEIYFNSYPYHLDSGEDKPHSSIEKRKYFDFIDIESLPSELWGYVHFPIAANYVNKYDTPVCMMNGKFHTAWGDFGSIRNINALEYECYRALAFGSRICIGDQLHPSGKLDEVIYNHIGKVLGQVERLEGYVEDAKKIRDVAVMIPSRPANEDLNTTGLTQEGVYRILSELHIPFDFVNCEDDYSIYKLMILPDAVDISTATAARIDEFVKHGGKLLATGSAAVVDGEFAVKSICASYVKPSEFDTRYIRLGDESFADIPAIDHVLYHPGENIKAKGDVLATIVDPYFARTYDRFCSHRQTPPKPQNSGEPAIVRDENGVYIAAPLFAAYADYGYTIYRDIIGRCIDMLIARPLFSTDLPAYSELTAWEHNEGTVVHMLNYLIQKKCNKLDTIEDRLTVVDKFLCVRSESLPSKVVKLPELTPVDFDYKDGYVKINIAQECGYTVYLLAK